MSEEKRIYTITTIVKSIFLCMGVLFFLCHLGEQLAAKTVEEEWEYVLYQEEGETLAELTNCKNIDKEVLVIPKEICDSAGGYYPIGSVRMISKEENNRIREIRVEENEHVVSFNEKCFMTCKALEKVEIVSGAVIEDGAFYGCKSLSGIQFGGNTIFYGKSMNTFAGCENLQRIIFMGTVIDVHGGVFDSIPRDDVSIYIEKTAYVNCDNDFSRGNTNLVCKEALIGNKGCNMNVKSAFFYAENARIEGVTLVARENVYAMTSSEIYKNYEGNVIDIVSKIELGNVKNSFLYVPLGQEKNITVEELNIETDGKPLAIKVTCLGPEKKEVYYVNKWKKSSSELYGAFLECEKLTAGKSVSPIIHYSGKCFTMDSVIGHDAIPTGIEFEYKGTSRFVEGMDAIAIKNLINVFVLYDQGLYKECISDSAFEIEIVENNRLVAGMDNQLKISVKKEYEISQKFVELQAENRQLVSCAAIFEGSTKYGEKTAYAGTKLNEKDIAIRCLYNNGDVEVLNQEELSCQTEAVVLGKRNYEVIWRGKTLSIEVRGVLDRISSVCVEYLKEWELEGQKIDHGQILFTITKESGTIEEVNCYEIEKAYIQEGENKFLVKYTGDNFMLTGVSREAELSIIGVKKENVKTEVYLKNKEIEFMQGAIIDPDLFGVRQSYQGSSYEVKNPNLVLYPYHLTVGENQLEFEYKKEHYFVSVFVKEATPTVKPEDTSYMPKETSATAITKMPSETKAPTETKAPIVSKKPVEKPRFAGKISIAGKGNITFSTSKKNSYCVYQNKSVVLAFSMEKIAKVQWQLVKKGDSCKNNKWKLLKGTIWECKTNQKAVVLYLKLMDEYGVTQIVKTRGFTIDKTKPQVNVKNNAIYKKGLVIKAKDAISGIKKITLNERTISNKKKVSKAGTYKLFVYDYAGNKVERIFYVK